MNNQKEQKAAEFSNPTVSIIVPVYNAANVLNRCVDSILRQNYRNFELILIDDGSQDASGKICEEYAAKDSRVRVIRKQNTGVSDSRNIAIRQARGTYLQFVDGDDWIAPEATGLLVSAAESCSCDLVVSDFYRVIDSRIAHKGDIQENGLLTREEFAAYMMEKPADFYYGVLWNKLYKRALVEKFQLQMNVEISWCEDFMFNLEYICHAKNIYILRIPIYYYVKTRHSLSTQGISLPKTIKMKAMVFEYYNKFYKEVFNEKDYEKSRLQVYRFFLDAANDGVVPPALLPGCIRLGEERTQINPRVMEDDSPLSTIYLEQKCLDACLQSVVFQYDLQMEEAHLLLCLSQNPDLHTRKELCELIGLPKRRLGGLLQGLKMNGYLTWEERPAKLHGQEKSRAKFLDIHFLPAAEPVLDSLKYAQAMYQKICFSEFTDEEIELYKSMSGKIKNNIFRTLL